MATRAARTRATVVLCAIAFGACAASERPPSQVGATTSPTSTTSTTTTTAVPPETAAPAPPDSASSAIDLVLHDYSLSPATVATEPGQVTLAAVNRDRAPHDVVILATELPPDRLPTAGIRIDEADPAVTVVARTSTIPSRGSAQVSASLGPGRYVLVCTVPHHYVREMMVGTLVVQPRSR